MITSLNSVARMLAIVAELFVGLLATITKARGLKPWLQRLLCGGSKESSSQNIKLILGLKGCKTNFFSNQLIYSNIKRRRRTTIKKLTMDGLIVVVKWHQKFIEMKFILNSSILLSILRACPSWIRKVNLVPNEAKLIIVVIDRLLDCPSSCLSWCNSTINWYFMDSWEVEYLLANISHADFASSKLPNRLEMEEMEVFQI